MKGAFTFVKRQGLLYWTLAFAFVAMASVAHAQSTVLISPTVNDGDFENATSAWTLVNGTETNKWRIDTGATPGFMGNKCAFVSNSAAAPYAHSFSTSSTSVVHLYQDITFPAGETNVVLSFKILCQGEGTSTFYDYLRVFVTPTSTTPTAGSTVSTAYQAGGTYNLLGATWQKVTLTIPTALIGNTTSATTCRLIFQWRNDGSGGTQPPAAIDSISLISYCAGVTASPATAVAATTATANWTAFTGATGYEVRYRKLGEADTVGTWANPIFVNGGSTTSLNLSNLAPNQTLYEYQVRALGAGVCPYWSTNAPQFSTLCVAVNLPYTETFEGITANNQLPNCMSATSIAPMVFTYTANQSSYNRTNHTSGGSKFASFRHGSDDWLFTKPLNLVAGTTYLLSFYYITDGEGGWDTLRAAFGSSATAAGMASPIGLSVLGPNNTTYKEFKGMFTATTTGVQYVGIHVKATSNPWYLTVDDINITALPACTGNPVAGAITGGNVNSCPGSSYMLIDTGSSLAGGLSYQWVQSLNNGATWTAVTGGSGANTTAYTTPVLNDTVWYRMVVSCAGGGQDTTAAAIMNIAAPKYAGIPYEESFENWVNNCGTSDAPSLFWLGRPVTGNASWRREDQGATASWGNVTSYLYSPVAFHGNHSARFHSGYASSGSRGTLDLYLDCSNSGGPLELSFRYINLNGSDSLKVYLSTDNGATFNLLDGYATAATWTKATRNFTSNSLQTIIRFEGKADYGSTDIGLDYVRVLRPCSGAPVAGTINNIGTVCPGAPFTLTLSGTSAVGGLTYQWQSSPDGNTWANIPGATDEQLDFSISTATYFRVIVTCSGSSTASASLKVDMSGFLLCYCVPTYSTGGTNDRINNVVLGPLANNTSAAGNPAPNFVDYTPQQPGTLAIPKLYQGVSDTVLVSFGNQATQYVGVWIDYNRNGTFDASEYYTTNVAHGANSTAKVPVLIPVGSSTGLTKMRIRGGDNSAMNASQACGATNSGNGEAEDYLVDLRFPPCTGPVDPGIALSTDTSLCMGYDLVLTDTTHGRKLDGAAWIWQTSADGVAWANVAGSQNQDQITMPMTAAVFYRMQMVCQNTQDTSYSNVVKVSVPQPWQCYCYSIATGRQADTTDFGSFKIGSYVLNSGGPHISNPQAVRGRTDNTNSTIVLYADSTYELNFYQTLRSQLHGDAKVTMFMDFNNNLSYDIPQERVLTMYTTASNWYLLNNVTIPGTVITDVPTGMRIIINSNTGNNVPSDNACGAYTSGETEDYVITFRRAAPTSVANSHLLRDLSLYPNPTEGRFSVQFNTTEQVKDLKVVVTNLTGQQVQVQTFRNPARLFRTDMDLSSQPRGVYMVEIHADGEKAVRKLIVR